MRHPRAHQGDRRFAATAPAGFKPLRPQSITGGSRSGILVAALCLWFALAGPAHAWLVERASLTNAGGQTSAPSGSYPDSQYPDMTPDGRYVLFSSGATNIVAGDTNGKKDLFLRDRKLGTTVRVNVSSDGAEITDQDTFQGRISADGRYVAFSSSSPQLAADANGKTQVYVRDLQEGTTTMISRGADNTPGNQNSAFNDVPVFSADGHFIFYSSNATNLVAGVTVTTNQIFMFNRQTGATSLITKTADGTPGNGSSTGPTVSADGRFIAFRSSAKNLTTPNLASAYDLILLHDRQTGETKLISKNAAGVQADQGCSYPVISGDGQYVVFSTYARNLAEGVSPSNTKDHVYLYDAAAGTLTLITKKADGTLGDNSSHYPVISPDGLYIAFQTDAQNLLVDNTNLSYSNILFYHRTQKTFQAVNVTPSGVKPNSGAYLYCAIAEKGQAVAFQSSATNLVPNKTHSYDDIFVAVKTTDGWTIGPRSQLGGWRDDLAVSGNLAVLIEAMSLSLFDLSGETPVKRGTLGLSHEPYRVTINGNRAYVIGSRFSAVDITNPDAPALLGECDAELAWNGSLAAYGNYFYHSAEDANYVKSIQIINLSDPAHPAIEKTLAIPADGFTIDNGKLYAIGNESGNKFWVYSLTAPLNPARIGELSGGIWGGRLNLYAAGSRVYSASESMGGVQIFDVSDPTLLNKRSNYPSSSEYLGATDVYASGSVMYITVTDNSAGNKVVFVDITNDQQPAFLGEKAITGASRVEGSGGAAYVMAMTDAAIQRVAVVGGQPVVAASAETPSMASGLLADAGRLYMGTADQLWIMGLVDPAAPQVLGRDTRWKNLSGFAVRENRLYGRSGTKLHILNVANPAALSQAGEYTAGGSIYAGALSGTTAFLSVNTDADYDPDTVEIVDVANPSAPAKLGSGIAFAGKIGGIAALGNLACLVGTKTAGGAKVVEVYDVTSPAGPVLRSTINVTGDQQRLWLSGTTLFVSSSTDPYASTPQGKLEAFDLTNPAAPARAGQTADFPKSLEDIQIITPTGKNPIVLTAAPGGSILTHGYDPASGSFFPGPACHSPMSHQVTATPSVSGSGYTVVGNDHSYGTYIQEIQFPVTKCCVTTEVSPALAAAEGCTATPPRVDPVTCGGTTDVTATAKEPWYFKEWTGAATGSSATSPATAEADCSMATAVFVKPILTLTPGGANPLQNEVYALTGEYNYTQGRTDVPIIQIVLTANQDDDWTVTSVAFETSGTGNEQDDVKEARLLLGSVGGNVLGTKTFGTNNQSLIFPVSILIPASQSRTLTLVYDFNPDKAFPCNDYRASTNMGHIVAIPVHYPPGVKLPTVPAGVAGGPTIIKRGDLVKDDGDNQYGEAENPAKNASLPKPLKARIKWQHPASVDHVAYQITSPASFGAFLGGVMGTRDTEKLLSPEGYAEEIMTLGTKKGKTPYNVAIDHVSKGAQCSGSYARSVFSAFGLGAELGTASQYDNPANGEKFGTFISNIQAQNKFTLTIDMTPGYAEVVSVVFSLGGQNVTATEVTHNVTYEALFDMAAFQKTEKLVVTVTLLKDGAQVEQKADYDVKCLQLPSWVGVVQGICAPDSFTKTFADGAYSFTFNYPTNFAWSDYVPGDVGLLGGLKNDIDIEFQARATYGVNEASVFGATLKGKPTILGKEFDLEGSLSGHFDPNFSFMRGNGEMRASVSFDLPEKSFSKTFMVGYVPVTAAVDLSGNVEIFVRGGAVLNRQLEFEEITIAPGTTVTGNVTISLAAVFGLAKIAATGSPTATVEIEVKYTTGAGTTYTWRGEIVVPITVVGSIFWGLGSAELCSTQLGPWTFPAGDGAGAAVPAAFRPLAGVAGPPAPRLIATSALAADGQGKRLSLWIGDRTPEAASPDPDVFFRHFNGTTWSESAPVIGAATNNEWETDPAAVFLPGGAALGCWTANKGDKSLTNLNDILAAQDIACALWSGTAWSAPARIIDDAEADGTVSLTYDAATGKALAVWVHNADPEKRAMQRTAWQLNYSLFDPAANGGAGSFTPPVNVPGTNTGKADQMPSVAANGAGTALLIWARDDDGQFYTELGSVANGTNVDSANTDSHILWSRLTSEGWTMPAALATGGAMTKLSPSLAFSPDGSALAVWSEKGVVEGVKKHLLKFSVFNVSANAWSTPALVFESGQFIEEPRAVVDATGKATVLWRGHAGKSGSGALFSSSGQMSAPVWSEPKQITHDDAVQWQPAVALDQNNKVIASWSGYNMATGAAQSGAGFGSSGVNVAQENPGSATLGDTYSARVTDTDQNGIYENLLVDVVVNAAVAGSYEVRADLYSGTRFVASARLTRNGLPTGQATFVLEYSGAIIGDRGYDGPYSLRNVVVMDLNGSPVQTAFAAAPTFATEPYTAASFIPGPLALDKAHYVGTVQQALITLTDPVRNNDAGSVQTVAVRVATTRDSEGFLVALTETGANTGVFQGSFGFSLLASSVSPARILVSDHDLIQVVYEDPVRSYTWVKTATWTIGGAGDVNGDGTVNLADAILLLKIGAGITPSGTPPMKEADVNADGKIGTEEVVYILQVAAGLR